MGRKRTRQKPGRKDRADVWKRFSWRGIGMDVPVSWELGAVSGDEDSGYFRLEDSFYTRLEAKWYTHKAGKPSLERIQENYLSQLGGRGRKKKNIEVIEGPSFRSLDEEGSERCVFRWASDTESSCAIVYRAQSQRVLLVQVVSRPGKGGARLAKRILRGLEDRSHDEIRRWAVYDLDFTVPRPFGLASHKLQSGLLEFLFQDGEAVLGVRRWSMADALLRRGELDVWLNREYADLLKDCQWERTELRRQGDEGISIEGSYEAKSARLVWPLLAAIPFGLGRRLPVNLCASIALSFWHCPRSNRILGVHLRDPEGRLDAFERVASSLRCHARSLEVEERSEDWIPEEDLGGQEGYLPVHSSQEPEGGVAEE